MDWPPEKVDLARRLARANGMNLCFREWNTEQHLAETVHWLRQLMPRGVDHLLLLSMYKHFARTTDTLWQIVDTVCPRATYLETNAVKQPPYPLADAVAQRKGTHLGFTQDRNLRAVYRVG